ncbi:hypothetical protein EYZ11_012857 [Aspergillus tanneri]|uniref:Uncharacterized protein n=1 Tax=Aspergillus tanneri TaxID=1220188 RepID=A0A4S3J4J7_9EURO|nr:hypothetical protein EYZ11_012857 [Aspergillus tanneri]
MGEACQKLGTSSAAGAKEQTSKAYFVKLDQLEIVPRDIDSLLNIPKEEVLKRMRAARDELAKFIWKAPRKYRIFSTIYGSRKPSKPSAEKTVAIV